MIYKKSVMKIIIDICKQKQLVKFQSKYFYIYPKAEAKTKKQNPKVCSSNILSRPIFSQSAFDKGLDLVESIDGLERNLT